MSSNRPKSRKKKKNKTSQDRQRPNDAATQVAWSMFPDLHGDVEKVLLDELLFYTFHDEDNDDDCIGDHDTNIMAESSRSRFDTILSKDTTRGFIISIASDVAFSVILRWMNRIRKECHTELRSGMASRWSPLHSHGIWTISAHMKATYAKDANMGTA
ncbi:hypothetical protein Purlil1_6008 [Purpureocillium lilacinum]|uniref:Uncharacterized protein n=1 Tax=Purpureocillium lilacinum TaxID=33203 RepID=A0ABR0BZH5_PURLI|nr:hypothetical protein Purlil1_6008 [Purpureocillium lilacinum]